MRPTHPRSLLIGLSAFISIFSFISEAKQQVSERNLREPECHVRSPEEAKQAFSMKIGNRIGKLYGQLTELSRRGNGVMTNAGSEHLDACQKALSELNDFCNSEQVSESKDCQAGGKSPVEGVDPKKAGKDKNSDLSLEDKTISRAVVGANCARAKSSCLKGGLGIKGRPTKSEVEKACLTDIDDELRKLGNPASNDFQKQQQKARLNAAKEMYGIVDKGIFEPQAECLKMQGEYFQNVGQTILDNYLARGANSRTAEQYSISCKERPGSFQECEYTINGETKLEEISQSAGKVGQPLEGAPSQLTGAKGSCSGECLNSDGNCTQILTASHCGPMSQAAVLDQNNQFQRREITSCREIANVDGQVCQFDTPVQTKPRFLRTLDQGSTSAECQTVGYVRKCGSAAFEKMSQMNPVQGQGVGFGGGKINLYRGDVYYDSSRGLVYHNFMMWRGDSGAAITIRNSDGSYDVVAAQKWSSALDREGYGQLINYQDFQKAYKMQSVDPMQLSGGTPIMWQLAKSIDN